MAALELADGQESIATATAGAGDSGNTDNAEPSAVSTPTGPTEEKDESAIKTETTKAKKDDGGRKRKRHLYNAIRGQMEFYFGDANLSKDRFLRRHVEQDPFVPLEIFLTFNKIKLLTQDIQQIATSLSNSQLLELDKSGLKVRRKTALPKQRDVNDRTLYVEALPANASHDWLKEVFSRYGPVAYVSLPHYPGTKKIKEFAFIEFERTASLEKAIKAFTKIQGVLAMDTDPAVLASIRTFQKQDQSENVTKDTPPEKETKKKGNLKREAVDNDDPPQDVKRVKLEVPKSKDNNQEEEAVTTASASEQSGVETDQDQTDPTVEGAETGDGKKRRRIHKKKICLENPNIEPTALELKVLPKTVWCSLRNKYLNLQRRMVSEAKAKLWRESHPHATHPTHYSHPPQKRTPPEQLGEAHRVIDPNASEECEALNSENQANTVEDGGDNAAQAAPAKRRKAVHKMNMNFYGAGGGESCLDDQRNNTKAEETTNSSSASTQERVPLFKYEPGLIIELSLLEPCANVKEFKADMRQYPQIKYVDIKEGDQLAHLRLETPNAAEDLIHQLNCAERQLKVLRGQAEQQYWRKIEQDREAKLTKKVRVQQKRGREKVSAKLLAKHIKFDDDDEAVVVAPPVES
ncbi:uncharacterized protein Dwil_GK25140 [Drosophila willistoni]|uniref:La-related protein 7 n=1 Tax=Drosophila willistoni TaxID=7260 RepID=B4NC56_DROWI|nr:la-related protein 7 [Drosophila willistoni]EDW82415.1 uncharacterized protein Dwil_GK25140 [Drosophila willistoni]